MVQEKAYQGSSTIQELRCPLPSCWLFVEVEYEHASELSIMIMMSSGVDSLHRRCSRYFTRRKETIYVESTPDCTIRLTWKSTIRRSQSSIPVIGDSHRLDANQEQHSSIHADGLGRTGVVDKTSIARTQVFSVNYRKVGGDSKVQRDCFRASVGHVRRLRFGKGTSARPGCLYSRIWRSSQTFPGLCKWANCSVSLIDRYSP
jgi:hypothetical protein